MSFFGSSDIILFVYRYDFVGLEMSFCGSRDVICGSRDVILWV